MDDPEGHAGSGRWRRWSIGVAALTVIVAAGVLAGQQVVGENPGDVSGGIGLPESEPPEPDARQAGGGNGQALGRGRAEPITCTRDDVEIPDCPRLLRTGLDMVAPPTDELVFERAGRWTIRAVDVTTGEIRWVAFRPRDQVLLTSSVGDGTLLLTSQGLRRVDADGQVRWQVQDVHADDITSVEAGEAGSLVLLLDQESIAARSADDGSSLWSAPQPEPSGGQRGVSLAGAVGTTLLFNVYTVGGSAGSVLALDALTGQLLWELPAEADRSTAATQVTGEAVLTVTYEIDGSRPPEQFDLVVRDPRDGAPLWEQRFAFGNGRDVAIAVGQGLVLAPAGGSLQALQVATGELAWETDPGVVFRPASAGSVFWMPTRAPVEGPIVVHRGGTLERLDPDDGHVLWSVDAPSRADIGIVSSTRAMRFSFGSEGPRITVYDVADGSEIATVNAEPNVYSLDPLVILDDNRLLLVPNGEPASPEDA